MPVTLLSNTIFMTNNDILRKIRYTFDYNDSQMITIFGLGDLEVNREQVSNWLKREDDPEYKNLPDHQFAKFLNGFIVDKRGPKDGEKPIAEKKLNNNIILKKLKIALNLKTDDMLLIFRIAEMRISEHELTAFFRNPSQKQFRPCQDQFLRNFLMGMQLKYKKVD